MTICLNADCADNYQADANVTPKTCTLCTGGEVSTAGAACACPTGTTGVDCAGMHLLQPTALGCQARLCTLVSNVSRGLGVNVLLGTNVLPKATLLKPTEPNMSTVKLTCVCLQTALRTTCPLQATAFSPARSVPTRAPRRAALRHATAAEALTLARPAMVRPEQHM